MATRTDSYVFSNFALEFPIRDETLSSAMRASFDSTAVLTRDPSILEPARAFNGEEWGRGMCVTEIAFPPSRPALPE